MRTAVAGVFAVLVVAVVAYLGWTAVASRLEPDDATADVAFDMLVAALSQGGEDTLSDAVRSGGDALASSVQAVETGLPVDGWMVERGPIAIDGAEAATTLTVTVTTSEVGDVTWQTDVSATRVRGVWGVDAAATTLHPALRDGYRVVIERTDVTRAPIVGVDGVELTSHGAARTIGIAPGRIVNEERLLSTWVQVLPESLEDLQETLARRDLNPDWYYPIVTVSQDRYEDAWARLRAVPGAISRESEATPGGGDFARHVLGRVGQPTAEQAANLGVDPSQTVGLDGLEREFEAQLVGSAVARILIVQPDGDEVAELGVAQDDPSAPLETTLDRTVQRAVENALVGIDQPAAVVVTATADSAIRASASRPLGGYNRAWEGNYPPGDAFLPVPAEALLAGDLTRGDRVRCPAREAVVGAAFDAPAQLGPTTVEEALAAGCDTTLAMLAADLDIAALDAAAARFGIGLAPEGLPLAAATSQLPTPVDTTELVRAANGQARVLASPLHVATLWGAAASGQWHPPYLLADAGHEPSGTALSPTAVEDLQALLAATATGRGSGASFAASGGAGIVGTAPVTGDDVVHAWAAGVAGDVAFAVVVEDTGGDTAMARTIAERFLTELNALTG